MSDKENAEKNLQEIWAKMIEEAKGEILPDEMCVLDFMGKVNEDPETEITRYQAQYYLETQVTKGRMTKRVVINTNYYRPVL
jgi:hypothetical protein